MYSSFHYVLLTFDVLYDISDCLSSILSYITYFFIIFSSIFNTFQYVLVYVIIIRASFYIYKGGMKMKINISEFINDCELSKGEIIKYLGISRSTFYALYKGEATVFNLKLFKTLCFIPLYTK